MNEASVYIHQLRELIRLNPEDSGDLRRMIRTLLDNDEPSSSERRQLVSRHELDVATRRRAAANRRRLEIIYRQRMITENRQISQRYVRRQPTIHDDQTSHSSICSICLEIPIYVYTTSCGHSFCRGCFDEWETRCIQNTAAVTCPDCRSVIPS